MEGQVGLGGLTTEQRFWNKVDCSGECWVWTAAGRGGTHDYGVFALGGKTYRAHRLAYEMEFGAIPDGLFVCHSCDNPRCVRPSHMFLGTQLDNIRDMDSKGRSNRDPKPMQGHRAYARPKYCKYGHERWSEIDRQGARHCLECHRQREKARRNGKANSGS